MAVVLPTLFRVSVTCRAGHDQINCKTKICINPHTVDVISVNADVLWRPPREQDHISQYNSQSSGRSWINQDCICLDYPNSNVLHAKIQNILQNIRFINRKKRVSDLFLDNAHSSMLLIELLLRKSTIGCYWVPDDDYRLFFGVLIKYVNFMLCTPCRASHGTRTHRFCLFTRLHKFHHEAFPSACCPVHSSLNPIFSCVNLIDTQSRFLYIVLTAHGWLCGARAPA